jgi:hypothetical protein
VPRLTECEGLDGRLIGPYNALPYLSAVAAVGGAVENRRAWRWCAAPPLVVVPVLRREAQPEYRWLLTQATERPRWWNRRRLAARARQAADSELRASMMDAAGVTRRAVHLEGWRRRSRRSV